MEVKHNNINKIFLVFLLCHALILICLFLFVKKEYHSDEIWSFGIANGSEAGAVFQDAVFNPINVNEWKSAEVLHENLSVQREERFHFEIPYRNSVDDAHPPLSFLLIHFISSLFPDKFSFWFYIPFNIIAMLLIDIFLYKILKYLELPEHICIFGSIYFAFCCGGINIAMYIRMYALLVAFGLMTFYFSLKVCREKHIALRTGLCLVVICMLGGITEYEFYVYSFLLTVAVLLILLFYKKIKTAFFYGLSMATGVGLSLLVFPEFFYDMFNTTKIEGLGIIIRYPYGLQLKILLSMIFGDIVGFAPKVFGTFGNAAIILGVIIYAAVIFVPLFILLRKSPKFIKMLHDILSVLKKWLTNIRRNYDVLLIALTIFVAFLCIMNKLVSVYHMSSTSTRIVFILYPVFYLMIYLLVYCITNLSENKVCNYVFMAVFLIFFVASQILGSHVYVGVNRLEGENLSGVQDSNIILVTEQNAELERIAYMIDASNRYICITINDLDEYLEVLSEVPNDEEFYLAVTDSAFKKTEFKDYFSDNDGPINFDELNWDGVIDENRDVLLDKLTQYGICKDYEYMGKEILLNSVFNYYRMTK